MHRTSWPENLQARNHLRNLDIGRRTALKRILNMYSVSACGMDSTNAGDHTQFNGRLWWRSLRLLALQLFMSFGHLSNFPPCFPIHSHLTLILNLHFPQILPDIILVVPILRTAIGLHSVILLTVLSLPILTICPIRLISVLLYIELQRHVWLENIFRRWRRLSMIFRFRAGRRIIIRKASLQHKTI